jgi:hypothetical protein
MHRERMIRITLDVPRGGLEVGVPVGAFDSGEAWEISSPSADRRGVCSVSAPGEVWCFILVKCHQD